MPCCVLTVMILRHAVSVSVSVSVPASFPMRHNVDAELTCLRQEL